MATTLDQYGNTVVNGYSTNIPPQTTAQTLNSGVQPFNITPKPPDTYPYQQTIDSSNASVYADAEVMKQTQEVQAGEATKKSSASTQASLYDQLIGRTADTQIAQESTGVNAENQKQNEYAQQRVILDAQAQSLNREAQAIPIQIQQESVGQGISARGAAPITAGRLRENALKALSIAQQSDILEASTKGSYLRLQAAKDKAQQIVDLKYKPIEDALAREKELYKLNEDSLKRIDAKRAEALNLAIKKDEQRIADEKANKKTIQDLIVGASPYAPPSVISNARKLSDAGKSPVEVAIALGKYGGDYLGDLVKRSTLAKNDIEMEKTAKEIKAMDVPLPSDAPVGSNARFTANLMNSAVNKESLTASEREKISKSFAVTQQLGNLSKNLQRDQTSLVGGKVKQVMAYLGADADAGLIQAQITALVPQVARGIFGEVGVLTNQDTNNYKKVIGNLTSPNDQNKAVTAMTLTALRNGVKSQLDVASASKLDVSRFVPLYQDLTNQINTINDDIGYTDVQVKEYADLNPQAKPMVEQLIKDGRKGSEILQILGVEY